MMPLNSFSNHRLKGGLFGLGAALLFGLTTPLIKMFLPDSGLLIIAGLLYVGAGIGLTLIEFFIVLTDASKPVVYQRETPIQKADLRLLLGTIVAGGILGPILMLYGLQQVSAVVGSLLLNLEAPLTVLLAVTMFREHLGRRETYAVILIFAGTVILSYNPGEVHVDWVGVTSIGVACLCWAVDNNLTQSLSYRSPTAIARIKGLSAGGFSLGLSWILGYELPNITITIAILTLGFLGYGVSVVMDIYALRLLGAAREAALFSTAPFIGALGAVPLLDERWTLGDFVAATIMAVGVVLLLNEHHSHMHSHKEMKHDHIHIHTDPHHQHNHEGEVTEPHAHWHQHVPLQHEHPHVSDLHHRHRH